MDWLTHNLEGTEFCAVPPLMANPRPPPKCWKRKVPAMAGTVARTSNSKAAEMQIDLTPSGEGVQ